MTLEHAIFADPDSPRIDEGGSAKLGAQLLELLTVLFLNKWTIAKITGIGAVAGIGAAFLLPIRYTSTVKILPPRQAPSEATVLSTRLADSATASLGSGAAGALNLLRNPSDIYIGLLGARPIADSLIREFDLSHVYRSKDMTATRQKLQGNSKIATESRSGIITVSVTDPEPERAARIANAYIAQLRGLTQTLAVTEASQRRLYYEEQLDRTKDALVTAEYAFRQVQTKKGLIQPDAQGKALISGLADLRARVTEKQVELDMLRSYSTERNPNVEMVQKELSSLKEEAHRLETGPSGFSGPGMKDVPGASLDYLRAQHELVYQQTLLDLLLKQYDAAKLDEAKDATVIQIVEPAIPAERRSSPQRTLITIFAVVLGLVVGCAYVLAASCIRRDPDLSKGVAELKLAMHLRPIPER